jgi:colicin import membrane protein
MVSDQRLHLTEQWQKLLQVQETWHQERAAALSDLEESAGRLAEREGEMMAAARIIEVARQDLERRQEDLSRLRNSLEAWQTRLRMEESAWQTDREILLAQIASRERMVQVRGQQLEDVHQRRNLRRRQEVAELKEARSRCDEARRQYAALWEDCEQLRATLDQQSRAVSSQALALERFRQETISQAADSVLAESQLEKLRKRENARSSAEVRARKAERIEFRQERKRLDEYARRLEEQEEELRRRQREWAARLAEFESHTAAAEEEKEEREQELRRLRAINALHERQLRQLRDEIERIARVMIEEAEETPPAQQAA